MTEPSSPREIVDQRPGEYVPPRFEKFHADAMAEINNIPGMPQEVTMGEPYKAKFKVGDVVVLRSGGPKMTVYAVHPYTIEAEWFAGDELRRDGFSEAELEHAPPKETP